MITERIDVVRPELLVLLALVPLLVALQIIALIARRRALVAFGGRGAGLASRSTALRLVKATLALTAFGAVVVALAGPQVGVTERIVAQQGVDVVIALDVSQSMATRDVAMPDRLRAARSAIETFARQAVGSRVALVLFAGDAVVRYPATSDLEVIAAALDTSSRGFKPQAGSSLRAGINASLGAFPQSSGSRKRAVVVISDGEDPAAQDLGALDVVRERGIRVFALGVGTPEGGQIATYDPNGRPTGPLRGIDGQPIISRLEEDGLRAIAERGGGKYWRYTGGDAPIHELVAELRALDVSEVSDEKVPADRFQWVLVLALALLVLDLLLSDRRTMPSPRTVAPVAGALSERARRSVTAGRA